MKYFFNITSAIMVALLTVSCSSVPDKPAEITSVREIGRTQLKLANQEIDRGNFDTALIYLEGAWKYAVRSDDPELRIKVRLSRGNMHLYQGQPDNACQEWDTALAEAEQERMRELAAAAKIHTTRGKLLEAISKGNANVNVAGEAEAIFLKEMGNIKKERQYLGLAWTSTGLAQKEQRMWDKAEFSLKNALQIHESGNYLNQAAYDWYLIASVRSEAGKYNAAEDALMSAISFDRRAENSYGLGCDWAALGDIYSKMGEPGKAEKAYLRAKDIFTAASMEKESDRVNQKLENLR